MTPDRLTAPRGPRLRLVCVNDIYALDALPRLRTLVQREATDDPTDRLLVTLAGDFLAPSLLSSLDHGRGMVDCLGAVGVTHVTFGNHEDDIPPDELKLRVRELPAVWLNTNVPDFAVPLPTHDVVEVRGPGRSVRVGLLGVVMEDPAIYRRAPFGGCRIEPANAAARREAARLLADGCACVLPLTHQPLSLDRELAHAQTDPPFPVIIGGHEHNGVCEQIGVTWLIKALAEAAEAIVVDLEWPAEAPALGPDLPTVRVRREPTAGLADDPAVRARVDLHMDLVRQIDRATLVRLLPGQSLSSVGARSRQTTLGTLICSRLRDALGADVCLVNGGGIRASRDYPSRITYGDIRAEMPFDNELVVAHLPGSVIAAAIAASRSRAPAESGGFLQVDDLTVVDLVTHQVTSLAGAPLDPARDYRVALVRNFLLGLDHIEPLIAFGREHPGRVPAPDSGRGIRLVLVDSFALDLWRQLVNFDQADTNRDGLLDAEELATAIALATSESPSQLVADLVLHAVDTDHDQLISRAEADVASRPSRPPASS
ncbi:MAG: hypothetical protein EOO75_12210 [Myxococcales bacterium]|nr:MAG: hypothetical protein EOO75_12210 [Myxococcales bacterium]